LPPFAEQTTLQMDAAMSLATTFVFTLWTPQNWHDFYDPVSPRETCNLFRLSISLLNQHKWSRSLSTVCVCVGSSFSWVADFNSWQQQDSHCAINTLWGRWG
jgi:hypothetical protein